MTESSQPKGSRACRMLRLTPFRGMGAHRGQKLCSNELAAEKKEDMVFQAHVLGKAGLPPKAAEVTP
ncbi:hypothetical protein [Salinibacter ruber]|uniref:hypothetical protein n=1 Tax=Salinibacter ruber TaxID=146919 RepID=UPI002072C347|nr:hypothetical protein [Salinibacter ruber]